MFVTYGALHLGCKFYKSESGAEAVRDWLKSLPKEVMHEIGADIAKVQRRWPVSRPLVGSFVSGLYEVVSTFNKNEYRVMFCVAEEAMVLLHGFQKKTQKTPPNDLKLARARQKEVES